MSATLLVQGGIADLGGLSWLDQGAPAIAGPTTSTTTTTTGTTSTTTAAPPTAFSGPGRRLRISPSDVEEMRPGGVYNLKYAVYDLNSGSFTLQGVSWILEDPSGATIIAGAGTVNNADPWIGRTKQTFQVKVDLSNFQIVPVGVNVAPGGFPYKMLVNADPTSLGPPNSMQSDWQSHVTAWTEYCYLVFTITCVEGDISIHRVPVKMISGSAP